MSKDSGENLSCPADMQSSLRDRIAAAIDQKYNEEAIGHTYEVCLQAADAVIADLKLHVVTVGEFQTVIKGSYPKPLGES